MGHATWSLMLGLLPPVPVLPCLWVEFGLHCFKRSTTGSLPSCFVLSSDRKQAEVRGPAPTATDRLWYVCVIGKARSLWATAAAKMKCVKAASLHVFPLD